MVGYWTEEEKYPWAVQKEMEWKWRRRVEVQSRPGKMKHLWAAPINKDRDEGIIKESIRKVHAHLFLLIPGYAIS